jgi:hypothetical protein
MDAADTLPVNVQGSPRTDTTAPKPPLALTRVHNQCRIAIFEHSALRPQPVKEVVMELIKVDSSMIYAMGYDEQQQVLEVIFKRTGVYRYHNVPKEVYQQLLDADSKGSYMRDLIIDMYPTERVR